MTGTAGIGLGAAALGALLLGGCVAPAPTQGADPWRSVAMQPELRPAPLPPAAEVADVVARVAPVARDLCILEARGRRCDFLIQIDTRPGQPVNAYQSLDDTGRPVITLTAALIEDARNADEIAFVLGHEAAHHIAGHLPRQRDTALAGALIAGTLAALGGADPGAIRSAQDLGAAVGARSYSKDYELEADRLGTVIAYGAGFDAERGAGFFGRLPDPGNRFLGSHPPNAARVEAVRRTLTQLRTRQTG